MEMLYSYLAGIIDGEAYVGTYTRKSGRRVFVMDVEMTVELIPRLLLDTFGGRYYERDRSGEPGRANEKPTYRWTVSSKKAREVYRTIEPYLRLKAGLLPNT